jgi:hypothetical protein
VTSYTYNLLGPTKKLSQLIAKSWLDGEELTIDKKFLVDNDILSEKEAELFKVEIKESGSGNIDAVKFKISFACATKRPQVTDQELQEWINSPENSPPWVPKNEILSNALSLWERIVAEL